LRWSGLLAPLSLIAITLLSEQTLWLPRRFEMVK
jgi:hypothetical protein